MAISPLKFSLGVSVFVHGIIIGGSVWLGHFHRTSTQINIGGLTTLELIAAPVNPAEAKLEAVPAAVTEPLPPPPSLPLPPLPEAVVAFPAQPTELTPVTVSVPVPPPTLTSSQSASTPNFGDGSSSLPGKDVTTLNGNPTALARPDYLKNQEPEYPLAARRRGQQGVVLLDVTVSPAGRAVAVAIKTSSGFTLLDQAALRAVREYEFVPAQLGTVRVESKIEVPIRFKLNR